MRPVLLLLQPAHPEVKVRPAIQLQAYAAPPTPIEQSPKWAASLGAANKPRPPSSASQAALRAAGASSVCLLVGLRTGLAPIASRVLTPRATSERKWWEGRQEVDSQSNRTEIGLKGNPHTLCNLHCFSTPDASVVPQVKAQAPENMKAGVGTPVHTCVLESVYTQAGSTERGVAMASL